jgi:hypothetical protein
MEDTKTTTTADNSTPATAAPARTFTPRTGARTGGAPRTGGFTQPADGSSPRPGGFRNRRPGGRPQGGRLIVLNDQSQNSIKKCLKSDV